MSTNRNRRTATRTNATDTRPSSSTRSDRSTAAARPEVQAPAQASGRRNKTNGTSARRSSAPKAAPVTVRVRETGESITRVPVQRSGYQVVRYEGYYRTVRGGGRTPLYITFDDMNGRA